MKIAVLSGKGGAGKTFVGTNLAAIFPSAAYVDCDVEEPNGHIFLHPQHLAVKEVCVPVPVVDDEKCTACRTCVDFCRYNALALIGGKVKVFGDICHNCGGCALFCPEKAIEERGRPIGHVSQGVFKAMGEKQRFYSGRLNPGEASGVPLIEVVLELSGEGTGKLDGKLAGKAGGEKLPAQQPFEGQMTISPSTTSPTRRHRDVPTQDIPIQEIFTQDTLVIDCPPGSACVVMESIKDADFCLLVAEPTIFGAHNLQMVHELVTIFKKKHGVVLNKDIPGEENPSARFCHERNIPLLGYIPYSLDVAQMNANGRLAVAESLQLRNVFYEIARNIERVTSRDVNTTMGHGTSAAGGAM